MTSVRPNHRDNPTDNTVQLARSRAGVIVVVAGDIVIAIAAFIGISKFATGSRRVWRRRRAGGAACDLTLI
jgi:hypothetical protein